jgi:probable rRNA maturation factor
MAREASFRIKPQELAGRALLVAFLPEPEARGLNKHYRNKDYATDVLSFGGEGDALGELAICPKVISRQARERGLLARQELGYMVLHGFLHLLGYDHERGGRAAARMFRLQDEIWDALQKR